MPRAQVLASSHPLVRATQRYDRARVRLLCGVAFLAAVGLTAHGPTRQAEVGIALVICAVLALLLPLYRNDPDALRRELGRIRYHLEAQ
jgi:hypothetical protein